MLYAMEDYAVCVRVPVRATSRLVLTRRCAADRYGYQTNARVKFVLAIGLADAVIRDIDVRTVSLKGGGFYRNAR